MFKTLFRLASMYTTWNVGSALSLWLAPSKFGALAADLVRANAVLVPAASALMVLSSKEGVFLPQRVYESLLGDRRWPGDVWLLVDIMVRFGPLWLVGLPHDAQKSMPLAALSFALWVLATGASFIEIYGGVDQEKGEF